MRLTQRDGDNVWFAHGRPRGFFCPQNFCDNVYRCNKVNDRTCPYLLLLDKLAAYEDAEEQGRLVRLPCKIGDKVRDKIADYVFTVEQIELGHKAGTLFRCGNPGTDDYMAFYDFEIGEKIEILTREEAVLKGGQDDDT